jgi:hypothetical protein
MTIQELAQAVVAYSAKKKDFIVPSKAASFNADMRAISFRDQSFKPNDWFMDQAYDWLGVPKKYAQRIETYPDLLAYNLNYLMGQSDQKYMIRTIDGTARAMLSSRYRTLDNDELLHHILPVFPEYGLQVESCKLTEKNLYLKVVSPRVQAEVVPGDVVQAGLCISNSEIRAGSVCIEPLLYRLVCRNGVVVNDARIRKYHVGRDTIADESWVHFKDDTRMADDRAFWLKVRDLVAAVLDQTQFDRLVDKMRVARTQPIESVEELVNRFALLEPEAEGVLNELARSGDMTLYGLINAVTRHSQDVESYERATELERVGGALLVEG